MSSSVGGIEVQVTTSQFYRARKAIAMVNRGHTWRGMFKSFISDVLRDYARYAAKIAPKKTGALSRAITWEYNSSTMKGSVFIDPGRVWREGSTPRWPHIYGVYVHERGGRYAFFERTLEERKGLILRGLHGKIVRLPWP